MAGDLLLARAGQHTLDPLIVPQAHRRWEIGATVWDSEADGDYLIFPYTGVAVLQAHIDGARIMVGTVGADGAIGLIEDDAAPRWTSTARAITAVEGWRIARSEFETAIREDSILAATITAYVRLLTLEARHEVICRTRHRAPERVAGWLAHVFDLAEHHELHLTQNAIADWFGVQRTTLNSIAKTLKGTGAIRHRRDKICLADRERLGRLGCDCRARMAEDRAHLGLPLPQRVEEPSGQHVRTLPGSDAFAARLSKSLAT